MKSGLIIAATLCVFCTSLHAQTLPYQDPSLPDELRVEDLLRRLSLEQKASLMINSSGAIPELGIREYDWWSEALHGSARNGTATVFPQAIGMAASFDDALLREVFDIASTEQRVKFALARKAGKVERYRGLTVWTPNINIFRDPRWGRGQETYGEDPYLTAMMGYSVVNGLQGDTTARYDKLHACLKHYAVHSGPEEDRHSFDISGLSYRDLKETYLYAFEYLVRNTDVQEVMCAYHSFDGMPCCGNSNLLTSLLRDEWGYKGLIVSDCGAIANFFRPEQHNVFPSDTARSAATAVLAGTDLECGNVYPALVRAVKRGLIRESDIDVSLRRVLKARFALGEMDPDSLVSWNSIPESVLDCPEHRQVSLKMARETMTLLQNRGGVLPLSKDVKVAVLGANAADSTVLWGNYNGLPTRTVTILQGIIDKIGSANVTYDRCSDLVAKKFVSPSAVLRKVEDADVIIYVGGISPGLEGEHMKVDQEGFYQGDRTSIDLPRAQRETLRILHSTRKPVILVNLSGSAMGLVPETESCDAILQAWYPGGEGGRAVADVLFGDYNPGGKLPVTFYRSVEDLPSFYDYDVAGHTYRYFDGKPLYPFGFGLSYTEFSFGKASVVKLSEGDKASRTKSFTSGDRLEITVPVTNCGPLDGDEVVQIYIRKDEDTDGPLRTLRGFRRVSIPAGGTVDVAIPLDEFNFRTYNESTGRMETTPGHYTVYYGSSSDLKDLQSLKLICK